VQRIIPKIADGDYTSVTMTIWTRPVSPQGVVGKNPRCEAHPASRLDFDTQTPVADLYPAILRASRVSGQALSFIILYDPDSARPSRALLWRSGA
jgi:hypothetical protein